MSSRVGVRVLLIVTCIAMAGAVVAGLGVLGSPAHQRALQIDRNRISNLSMIANGVQLFWTRHSSLPNDLSEVGIGFTSSKDPVTGQAYAYSRVNTSSYHLCAVFDAASESLAGGRSWTSMYVPNESDWKHPAGQYCFAFSVDHGSNPIK